MLCQSPKNHLHHLIALLKKSSHHLVVSIPDFWLLILLNVPQSLFNIMDRENHQLFLLRLQSNHPSTHMVLNLKPLSSSPYMMNPLLQMVPPHLLKNMQQGNSLLLVICPHLHLYGFLQIPLMVRLFDTNIFTLNFTILELLWTLNLSLIDDKRSIMLTQEFLDLSVQKPETILQSIE
jgi:hypothetical protein